MARPHVYRGKTIQYDATNLLSYTHIRIKDCKKWINTNDAVNNEIWENNTLSKDCFKHIFILKCKIICHYGQIILSQTSICFYKYFFYTFYVFDCFLYFSFFLFSCCFLYFSFFPFSCCFLYFSFFLFSCCFFCLIINKGDCSFCWWWWNCFSTLHKLCILVSHKDQKLFYLFMTNEC